MSTKKTLISVLNYNNFDATKKCILSILDCSLKNIEIFITDNDSTDNSYQKLKKCFKKLKVVKSKSNMGYAAGHKIGVDYAIQNGFDFIWLLNNDLTVRKKSLHNLLKAYISYSVGIYGSITLKSENPDVVNFGGGKTDDISKAFDYNAYENYLLEDYYKEAKLRAVQSVEGSSMLIPIEIITKYGFLREDFFMYGEETDYCYSLKKHGISSYIVPESVVIHKGAESLKNSKHLESYYRRRNMLYFERDHYGVSIFKNINKRTGVFQVLKFFIKNIFIKNEKNELYYINIANIHALSRIKGVLKVK